MDTPRVSIQHDYISIDLGNARRLTTSRSGQKGSGHLPAHVWKAWVALFKGTGKPYGERAQDFAANLSTLWPEWNVAPRKFKVGESVRFDFGQRNGGEDTGTVLKAGRGRYHVRFARMGVVSVTGDSLSEANP